VTRPQRPRTAPTGTAESVSQRPESAWTVAEVIRGTRSELEAVLANRLHQAGVPLGEAQWPVVAGRRFRFDRAWPAHRVACEVNGGIYSGGRHVRGKGHAADCEKLSIAASLGWRVLVVTREMIEDGSAVDLIRKSLVWKEA
jgi:hypothetical protein